jgi:hypothetical protein
MRIELAPKTPNKRGEGDKHLAWIQRELRSIRTTSASGNCECRAQRVLPRRPNQLFGYAKPNTADVDCCYLGIGQRLLHCIICTYACANALYNSFELWTSQQEQYLRAHGESSEPTASC